MEDETHMQQLEEKIDAIYTSVEKTRKYFVITMWVTLGAVLLPVLGLIFVIPMFVSSYLSNFEGLL